MKYIFIGIFAFFQSFFFWNSISNNNSGGFESWTISQDTRLYNNLKSLNDWWESIDTLPEWTEVNYGYDSDSNSAFVELPSGEKWYINRENVVIGTQYTGNADRIDQIKITPQYSHGYRCTQDCSWHEAGYNWAEKKWIDDISHCGGNSQSFIEWCRAYVEENFPTEE